MAKKPTKPAQLLPWEMIECPVCKAEVGRRCWDLTKVKSYTTIQKGGRGGPKVIVPEPPITRTEPHETRVNEAKRRKL